MRSHLTVLALLAALPAGARAHETLHEIERGRAIAVRVYHADGEALAGAAYEVYAPDDPAVPWQTGRTDRQGWLSFLPGVQGRWRVRVMDGSGHGLDLAVEAAAAPGTAGPAPGSGRLAFVLRPLAGLAAIGALFLAIRLLHRRKRHP